MVTPGTVSGLSETTARAPQSTACCAYRLPPSPARVLTLGMATKRLPVDAMRESYTMSLISTSTGPQMVEADTDSSRWRKRNEYLENLDLLCPSRGHTRDSLKKRTRDTFQGQMLQWRANHVVGADIANDVPTVATLVAVYAPQIFVFLK